LQRKDAEKDYMQSQIDAAKKYFIAMSASEKEKLTQTVLLGLPGSLEAYSLENFKLAIDEYREITANDLRDHLIEFLKEIVPVAEECGVFMVVHPDDPPWPLLGLPRVVGNKEDLHLIVSAIDSPSNGITFCAGSLGAGYKNDLIDMVKTFSGRVNFLHLRNLTRDAQGNFMEAYHLDGDLDLFEIMKALVLEQNKRITEGRKNWRMPIRPDHGQLMAAEPKRPGIYPGYSLLGRMRGLAELRGLEMGIRRSLNT
jgi:mannonate dehydratase